MLKSQCYFGCCLNLSSVSKRLDILPRIQVKGSAHSDHVFSSYQSLFLHYPSFSGFWMNTLEILRLPKRKGREESLGRDKMWDVVSSDSSILLWKTWIPGDSQGLGKLENEYGCSIIAKGWSEVPRTWSTGEHIWSISWFWTPEFSMSETFL